MFGKRFSEFLSEKLFFPARFSRQRENNKCKSDQPEARPERNRRLSRCAVITRRFVDLLKNAIAIQQTTQTIHARPAMRKASCAPSERARAEALSSMRKPENRNSKIIRSRERASFFVQFECKPVRSFLCSGFLLRTCFHRKPRI